MKIIMAAAVGAVVVAVGILSYRLGVKVIKIYIIPPRVAEILREQRRPQDPWTKNRVMKMFRMTGVMRNCVKSVVFLFLLGFYVVQICYQTDVFGYYFNCKGMDVSATSIDNGTDILRSSQCRTRIKDKFTVWGMHYNTATGILTFLLGFYVSTVVSNWWTKVTTIPDPGSILMMLGGLTEDISDIPYNSEVSLTNPETVIEVKKMIGRYCLLSWTMCYNTVSPALVNKFGSVDNLVKKGLLMEREVAALQVILIFPPDILVSQVDRYSEDTLFSDKWWLPLNWAISLSNKIGHTAHQKSNLFPKFIERLLNFQDSLDNQKTCQENQLPIFYKNVRILPQIFTTNHHHYYHPPPPQRFSVPKKKHANVLRGLQRF